MQETVFLEQNNNGVNKQEHKNKKGVKEYD